MGVPQRERHDTRTLFDAAGTEDPDPLELLQALDGVADHVPLMGHQRIVPDRRQVVDGGAEPDGAGDVRRARLELVGHLGPGALLALHHPDHLAAAVIRRHGLQELPSSPHSADAGGTAHLVSREGVHVDVQSLDVHR